MPGKLARGDAKHAPVLNEDGQVERFILESMDGTHANEKIARDLMQRFPSRFRKLNHALGRVGSVARRFARD